MSCERPRPWISTATRLIFSLAFFCPVTTAETLHSVGAIHHSFQGPRQHGCNRCIWTNNFMQYGCFAAILIENGCKVKRQFVKNRSFYQEILSTLSVKSQTVPLRSPERRRCSCFHGTTQRSVGHSCTRPAKEWLRFITMGKTHVIVSIQLCQSVLKARLEQFNQFI